MQQLWYERPSIHDLPPRAFLRAWSGHFRQQFRSVGNHEWQVEQTHGIKVYQASLTDGVTITSTTNPSANNPSNKTP